MKRNIESFLEYMVIIREAAPHTIEAYRSDLTAFAEDMAAHGVEEVTQVTEELLADYFFVLEAGGMSGATLARRTSSLRVFFRFLVENDDVQRNVTDILERPGAVRKRPLILSAEEIDRLLAAPDGETPLGSRDRAILELLYATGIKVGELVMLYPADIDLRSSILRVEAQDKKPAREIPFGEKARDALLNWIGKGRSRYVAPLVNAPLFVNTRGTGLTRQSVWKIVRRYAQDAGIRTNITPGVLRHSFASHLMENGADVRSLTLMMGYAAEAQAQVYENDKTERLRNVYARAQKRG